MITTEPITTRSSPPSQARPAPTPTTAFGYAELDAYVEREMKRLRLPGVALAVVEGDRITHLRGFGRFRRNGGPPGPQTPFLIGSITKSFTALAVMQLVEAGKVELDAPVRRYLPWFRVADAAASEQMTVRHLLNQTSGLSTAVGETILADLDDRPGAAERQARALASFTPARPPGAEYEYSNSNYQVLGLIIEAAGGEPYAEYLRRHIFAPLDMNHTSAAPVRQPAPAEGYRFWFGLPVAAPDVPLPHGALAAGLLSSTAEDLARYLIAHLNGGRCGDGQLLSAASISEMHRGAVDVGTAGLGPVQTQIARRIDRGQYGMGWSVDVICGTRVVWHGGTLPNFGGYVALLPEHKKGIVLLYNANHHWYMPALADFGTVAAALLVGERHAPLPFGLAFPWLMRGLLAIPVLQLAGIAATLRLARRDADAPGQPVSGKEWRRFLLPNILHVVIAVLFLRPLMGRRRDYLRLYMPDFALIATVSGLFSAVWALVRAGLFIGAIKRHG